jgi:hypothetical protein
MLSNFVGSTSGRHTAVVHVGTPSPYTQDDWVKTKVYFHEFADVPSTTELVQSPPFYYLGHEWSVLLYPRGDKRQEGFVEGSMSLYLNLSVRPDVSVEIEFGFAINDFLRSPRHIGTRTFGKMNYSSGWNKFIKHEKALLCLVHGALVIEVRMKPVKHGAPFLLENPSNLLSIKDFFMDEKSSDIIFEVGEEQLQVGAKRRRGKILSTKFYAHSKILEKAAPQLAELCNLDKIKSPSVIELHNTSPDRFKEMLLYLYGCKIPGFGNDISHTKDIIELADKYGVISLKLEAEALYVSSLMLTLDNVMEHLSFAEAKNCAYLKEKILDFIVKNTAEITKRKMLTTTTEGPNISDILAAVARAQAEQKDEKDFSIMSISELRRNAHKKKLNVDGSREMLRSALENSTK